MALEAYFSMTLPSFSRDGFEVEECPAWKLAWPRQGRVLVVVVRKRVLWPLGRPGRCSTPHHTGQPQAGGGPLPDSCTLRKHGHTSLRFYSCLWKWYFSNGGREMDLVFKTMWILVTKSRAMSVHAHKLSRTSCVPSVSPRVTRAGAPPGE